MLQMTLEMAAENCVSALPIKTDKTPQLAGKALAVFDAMRAIVEAPGCILTDYKVDFYKYDRDHLVAAHGIGPFIWIVREMGTHLIRVGIHSRAVMDLDAVLSIGHRKIEIYLVDTDKVTVRKITEGQARDAVKKLTYKTSKGTVTVNDRPIAWLAVKTTPYSFGKDPQGLVEITALASRLSKADLLALRQIAANEVIAFTHSLFTGMQSCTVNGVDIDALIDQAD